MTVYEYRQRLLDALAGYDPEEAVNAANYYAELIEDAEDPADQMMRLGVPEELAQRIITENGWSRQYVPMDDMPRRSSVDAGRIIALIISFPVWITVYALILALIITVTALVVALPLGFAATLIEGIRTMGILMPFGIELVFSSLIMLGFFVITISVARPLFSGAGGLFGRFSRFLFGTKRQEGLQDGSVPVKGCVKKAGLVVGALIFAAGLAGTIATGSYNSEHISDYAEQLGIEDMEIPLDGTYNAVYAEINRGTLTVEKSTDGRAFIKCEGIMKDGLDVTSDEVLNIIYDTNKDDSRWGFYVMSSIAKEADNKFTLCLPEKQYENFYAKVSLGKLDVDGIKSDGITLCSESGSITVSDCEAKDFGADSDIGNIKIHDIKAHKADIACQSGNISITDGNIPELELKSDLGSIKLDNITSDSITSENHSGKTELTGSSVGTLNVYNDLGSVDMKGCTLGKITIESHSGNTSFEDCTQSGIMEYTGDLGNLRIESTTLDILTAGLNSGNLRVNNTSIKRSADINVELGNVDMELTGGSYAVKGSAEMGNVEIDEDAVSGDVPVNIITDSGNINVRVD